MRASAKVKTELKYSSAQIRPNRRAVQDSEIATSQCPDLWLRAHHIQERLISQGK